MNVRLLLVDNYAMFRDGLRAVLEREPGMKVVGEAGDTATAIRLSDELRPDVILTEVHLGDENAVAAIRLIVARHPESHVIILTMNDDCRLATEMLRAGVHGYLLKGERSAELLRAVRAVLAGGTSIEPGVASRVIDGYRQLARAGNIDLGLCRLTRRDLDMLSLLVEGEGNRRIAERLHLSPQTVKNRLSGIYQQLGVGNRTEAVVVALRLGLVEGDGWMRFGNPLSGRPASLAGRAELGVR